MEVEDYLNSSTPLYFVRFEYRQNDYVFINNGSNLGHKWADLFRDISALIFVVDINMYFQRNSQTGQNLLLEQMQIFDATINSDFASRLPIILLLNKYDQFKVNVHRYPLHSYFPDFKLPKDRTEQTEDDVREYISKRFKALNRNEKQGKRMVYPFAVHIIDEDVVKKLIDTITAILQKEELRKIGFK